MFSYEQAITWTLEYWCEGTSNNDGKEGIQSIELSSVLQHIEVNATPEAFWQLSRRKNAVGNQSKNNSEKSWNPKSYNNVL